MKIGSLVGKKSLPLTESDKQAFLDIIKDACNDYDVKFNSWLDFKGFDDVKTRTDDDAFIVEINNILPKGCRRVFNDPNHNIFVKGDLISTDGNIYLKIRKQACYDDKDVNSKETYETTGKLSHIDYSISIRLNGACRKYRGKTVYPMDRAGFTNVYNYGTEYIDFLFLKETLLGITRFFKQRTHLDEKFSNKCLQISNF